MPSIFAYAELLIHRESIPSVCLWLALFSSLVSSPVWHTIFTVIQTAPGSIHIDIAHTIKPTGRQMLSHQTQHGQWFYICQSAIGSMWNGSINFIFFSLTDVLHHERVMMEGKMNCHWHISSCIAILNIRDICQKTCHRFCNLFFADDLKGKFEIGTYFSQWGLWPQDLA